MTDKAMRLHTENLAMEQGRQAVVVLAMHRTGSSALTRMLNLLGCDLPKTKMGGDTSNPTGHWESTEIRALNDDILASAGSDWQDWTEFNPHWYDTVRPAVFRARAHEVLAQEYEGSPFLVFKDPRVCRIFPFWKQVFAEAGSDLRIILTLRNPTEVAASLTLRNQLSELRGLLLWLRHTLDAEVGSRGMWRTFVTYDDFMAQPVQLATALQDRLGLFWPRLSDQVADEITAYVSPDLRHNKAPLGEIQTGVLLRPWLTQTYDILLRWSRQGEDSADYHALDTIRTALNGLSAPLREVVALVDQQQVKLATQAREIIRLGNEAVAPLTALTEEQAAELSRRRDEIAAKDKELGYLRGEAGKRGNTVTALTEEKKHLTTALDAEREARRAESSRFETELQQAQATAEAQRQEAERLQLRQAAELATLTALLDQAEQRAAELETELGRLRDEIAAKDKDLGYLRGEAGKRGHAVTALTEEKKHLTAALDAEREARSAENSRFEAELQQAQAAAEAQRQEAERRWQQQTAEMAALRAQAEHHAARLEAKLSAMSDANTDQEAEIIGLRDEAAELLAALAAQEVELTRLQDEHAAAAEQSAGELRKIQSETEALRADLANQRAVQAETEAELTLREAELDAAQAEMHLLRSTLNQRSAEADQTAAALATARQEIVTLQAELSATQGAGRKVEANLAERDRATRQLRQRLAELDGTIDQQANELARMAKIVIEKEEALKQRNAAAKEAVRLAATEAEQAAQRISVLLGDLDRLQAEMAGRDQALIDAEARCQALIESTSWRVTAPLRRVSLLMKR